MNKSYKTSLYNLQNNTNIPNQKYFQTKSINWISSNLKIILTKIFPWKTLFKITIINTLLGISVYFLKLNFHIEQITGEIFESIILGFIWALIYGIIMSKSIQKFWMSLR